MGEVRICLVRHGKTQGNVRRAYIGCRSDEKLCAEGRRQILCYKKEGRYPQADFLYLSPMKRCLQTAEIIWPALAAAAGDGAGRNGRLRIVPDLRECDFGRFEGKSYSELNGTPDFQHWVDSGGTAAFPGGENPAVFRRRSTDAFLNALDEIFRTGIRNAAFCVHGGTVMSVMSEFEGGSFYEWHVENGDGYRVTLNRETWMKAHRFLSVERLLEEEDT